MLLQEETDLGFLYPNISLEFFMLNIKNSKDLLEYIKPRSLSSCNNIKNSKDLLEYIKPRSLSSCNNIKTFDFSTIYTTITHVKLKDILKELGQLYFLEKEWQA
jgi:hypothetical protein